MIFADEYGGDGHAFFALVGSRSPVSTLDTRVTIERVHRMLPSTEDALVGLVTDRSLAAILRKRLAEGGAVVRLTPALSSHPIDRLAEIEGNRGAMRSLIALLDAPRVYSGMSARQEDAVHMALRAFGLTPYDAAPIATATIRTGYTGPTVNLRKRLNV